MTIEVISLKARVKALSEYDPKVVEWLQVLMILSVCNNWWRTIMAWTATICPNYDRLHCRYASDVTDKDGD